MTQADTEVRYRVHPQAAHRQVAGEIFVVTGDRGFHRLRVSTAVALFSALVVRPRSMAELVSLLCERFQVDVVQAEVDVNGFLQVLLQRQLVIRDSVARESAA